MIPCAKQEQRKEMNMSKDELSSDLEGEPQEQHI
jgi:hypothetical protein